MGPFSMKKLPEGVNSKGKIFYEKGGVSIKSNFEGSGVIEVVLNW